MQDRKDFKYTVRLLLIGISGSIIFISLGYWIAGTIGLGSEQGIGFFSALCMALAHPFEKRFNNLTPVAMIVGFILFEGVFFLLFARNRKREAPLDGDAFAPDIIGIANQPALDNPLSVKHQNILDKDLFAGALKNLPQRGADRRADYVVPGDMGKEPQATIQGQTNEPPNNDGLSFNDDIVTELLNDYELPQIAAMLQIKKYIEINDTSLLRKMFKPTMSADDISSYIEMFYG